MRQYYYTAQPLEVTMYGSMLRQTFEMIDARDHLLYASGYPHWDFGLPSAMYDLPFLTNQEWRNILGENARRLFGRPVPERLAPTEASTLETSSRRQTKRRLR